MVKYSPTVLRCWLGGKDNGRRLENLGIVLESVRQARAH
jgi:hypothetical protein